MKNWMTRRFQWLAVFALAFVVSACQQTNTQRLTFNADSFFETGSYQLNAQAKFPLDRLVQQVLMNQNTITSIRIVGHTDNVGSMQTNQVLSERRAIAVRDYLVNQGVNPAVIVATGKSYTMPIGDNSTSRGRADNRRVDIDIYGARAPIEQLMTGVR